MSRGKKPEQEKRNLVHVTRGNKQDKEARGRDVEEVTRCKARHYVRQAKARKSKARRGVQAE